MSGSEPSGEGPDADGRGAPDRHKIGTRSAPCADATERSEATATRPAAPLFDAVQSGIGDRESDGTRAGRSAPPPAGAEDAGASPLHDSTHLDWITVTHAERGALWELLRPPVARRRCGLGAYRESSEDGYGALFAAGGPEPRPYMLRMGGKALQAWRGDRSDSDLVFHLAMNGAHVTRLDLARDTAGPWTPGRLWSYLTSGRYVSAWRDFTAEQDAAGRILVVRLGSRSSEVFLRVYDKRAEMEHRGEVCSAEQLTRWEFEVKGDRAQVAFDELARSLPDVDGATGEESWHLQSLHAAWLRDRLELTTRPVDRENRNQSKADADGEWTEFVRSPSNCVLAPEAETRDVPAQAEAFAGWLVRQFSSALACLVEVCGPEVVAELLHRGGGRMNARHRMFVERAEESRPGMLAGLARACAAEVAPEVP